MKLSNEQINKQIELNKKLLENIKTLEQTMLDISNNLNAVKDDVKCRNVLVAFWTKICERYNEDCLLNCDGDVFYIDERQGNKYMCRRVLWSLDLSRERYEIVERIETDIDGEFDYRYYEMIDVLL